MEKCKDGRTSDKTQSVVNDLLKRISNLEFDVEDKQREIENLKQINEEHKKINGELRVENDRLNNIVNEFEKDMIEKYHKEIDYQSKIMQSDLMQGDYPIYYYYAEQNEKLLNYYLNKLQELKGSE